VESGRLAFSNIQTQTLLFCGLLQEIGILFDKRGSTMIVKRITEAFRRQDWAVVSIEFALVVVGVLLAFQINEYANGRQAAKEREAAADRLLGESEESVAYLRQAMVTQRLLVADLNFALTRIQAGRWLPSEEPRMTSGLSRAKRAPPLAPPSSVYDDLVASGVFGKVGNANLRSGIAKYRATLGFSEEVRATLTQNMPSLEDYPALRYSFSLHGRERTKLEVDYPTLLSDRLLQEKLALLADDQRVFLRHRQRAFKDAARMCVELGLLVKKGCNLNLPPPSFD